jgi:methionyl-tRNA formyltransferase
MAKRVKFLGYNREQTRLIDLISGRGLDVEWTGQMVNDLSAYELAISFGYGHILKADVLATAKRPVLNLHIAYLPWNRGAHPLFWAAYDGTPAGVTIHEIDSGVDTGPICFQRKVRFDYQTETFTSAYRKLIEDIEALFEEHAAELLTGDYTSRPQEGLGSLKRVRDLPSRFSWSEIVAPTIKRLKQGGHA